MGAGYTHFPLITVRSHRSVRIVSSGPQLARTNYDHCPEQENAVGATLVVARQTGRHKTCPFDPLPLADRRILEKISKTLHTTLLPCKAYAMIYMCTRSASQPVSWEI